MMTENKRHLVPEIRFKGFTNVWEQRELNQLANFTKGSGYTKGDLRETGMPIILYGRLYTDYETLIKDVNTFVEEKENSVISLGGEVIVPSSGESAEDISRASVVGKPGIILGGDLNIIKPNDKIDPVFLALAISNGAPNKEMAKRAQGKSVVHLHNSDLQKINLIFPKIEEQRSIVELNLQLDNLITLHKRKLDGLITLKDGFLQQMFPAANEVMPRVRIAGFTGKWEERRLEEMLTERNEQFEESEDYPLMSFVGNVGVVPKGEQYDRSFLVKGDGKKYKKTELNDFIYSSNNLETGSIGLNRTGKAVISPVYSIFYSSNDSESLFVGLLSKRKDFINKMIHYRQGVMYGQWRIHERDFLKIIVLTPTISEQNRIIDFFKNFDEQIAAQTAKIDQLRQLKAAYLQRMFI